MTFISKELVDARKLTPVRETRIDIAGFLTNSGARVFRVVQPKVRLGGYVRKIQVLVVDRFPTDLYVYGLGTTAKFLEEKGINLADKIPSDNLSSIGILMGSDVYHKFIKGKEDKQAPLVAVYAVRGQTARLPCNLTTPPEDPVIVVLWYKNGTKIPVFSVDFRSRGLQEAGSGSTRPSDAFGGRATFQEQQGGWSWVLVVREVEFTDQGEFRCRLDFQSSPTHNGRVLLRVVDLPRQLRIYSPGGALVEGVPSVQEDQPLTLSCRATGGEPLPNVTWWSGPTLLDSEAEEWQEGGSSLATPTATPTASYVTNTLHVAALTRAHLVHNLTCTAANTPALPPLSASVFLRETDSELRVEMQAPTGKLSGGRQYHMRCEASGVRPPPVLTWWLRGQHLTHNIHVQSLGVDSTVSLLRLLATAGDDGGLLECRAAAPTLPHLLATDSYRLTVHYVPEASISIEGGGSQGRVASKIVGVGGVGGVGGLRAGDSATLTCAARANPPAYNFTFLFNGRMLTRPHTLEDVFQFSCSLVFSDCLNTFLSAYTEIHDFISIGGDVLSPTPTSPY
ncbi:synaptogenesis protein syg-2 [Procambarus clarkii]|uniref:synaptogenesis protein syg-2 n=1 Tax=Procambarus clarkii TaxID=6728 RepID=UPI0037424F36